MDRIRIVSSGRIVPIIDNQDGTFFVVGNSRRGLVDFPEGCFLSTSVSGPYAFSDARFSTP